MAHSLVAFDTDHVKQYVFATEKLKEIRGASALLDELNRKETPGDVVGRKIYAHGGSGLFIVEAGRAASAIEAVRRAYAKHTKGAATITGVACPLPDGFDLERDDVRPLWDHLTLKLNAAKGCTPMTRALVTHPLLRPCDSCGTFYSSECRDGECVCPPCVARRRKTDAIRRQDPDMPEDFETIGETSAPKGYFALIYADGDGLGRDLAKCQTLVDIETFAEVVDGSLREVVGQAIAQLSRQSYDVLLLGGDDLVMVIQAQSALEAAITIVEQFRARTQAQLGRPLTLSAAVVWAHAKFPFGAWLELAESALKFAKKQGALRQEKGLINFLVVSSANHLDFGDYYKRILKVEAASETLYRTLRPYSSADLRTLLDYRRRMAAAPRSKLEALRRAAFQPSRQQAMIDGLTTLLHWRSEKQRHAFYELPLALTPNAQQRFPWAAIGDEYYTPFIDLTEIWDFTPAGGDIYED